MLAASGLNEERYIVKVLGLGKMFFWKSKLKINMPGKKLLRFTEFEDSVAAILEDILELLTTVVKIMSSSHSITSVISAVHIE